MPILVGLQRRFREIGRIRCGDQVVASSGKSRPNKLSAFRLTSEDQDALLQAAGLYGGEVRPWKDAPTPNQFELYTDAVAFDVLFPATDLGFSQYFEDWTAAVCQRRCDGVTDTVSESPCVCDPAERQCKPVTRLNVILAELQGIGTWRLQTTGYFAASEMGSLDELLKNRLPGTSSLLPARLMLTNRQTKKVGPDGKTITHQFLVPVLDVKTTPGAMLSNERIQGVTPIQSETPALPSVREQFEAAKEPQERPKRANSTAPLPSTGLRPRGASGDIGTEVLDKTTKPAQAKTEGGASQSSLRRLFAIVNGNKDIDSSDDGRKAWASTILGRTVASFNNLTSEEIQELSDIAPTYKNADGQATLDAQAPF